MQLEHEPISEGKKGQDIAVKVDKVIKKDVSVYKV
jgi:hypothetical protein